MGSSGNPDGLRVRSSPAAGRCFACSSKPGSVFCDLPQAALLELDTLRQASVHPKGSTVFLEGDQPQAIYCIGAGQVKLTRSSREGRDVVLGIATAGDVLGVRPLLIGRPHDVTAETTEKTRLCLVPRHDFLGFVKRNGDVSLRLAEKLSINLGDAYQQVCGVVLKPTAERLTELLFELCQAQGQPAHDGIGFKTNMGQDELAGLVGVSRRSLNRALATLRESGLIECRRRCIIIRDPVALQSRLAS